MPIERIKKYIKKIIKVKNGGKGFLLDFTVNKYKLVTVTKVGIHFTPPLSCPNCNHVLPLLFLSTCPHPPVSEMLLLLLLLFSSQRAQADVAPNGETKTCPIGTAASKGCDFEIKMVQQPQDKHWTRISIHDPHSHGLSMYLRLDIVNVDVINSSLEETKAKNLTIMLAQVRNVTEDEAGNPMCTTKNMQRQSMTKQSTFILKADNYPNGMCVRVSQKEDDQDDQIKHNNKDISLTVTIKKNSDTKDYLFGSAMTFGVYGGFFVGFILLW